MPHCRLDGLTLKHMLLVIITTSASISSLRGAEVPAPAEILSHIQDRQGSLQNLSITAEWEEFKNGKRVTSSQQTLYKDNLGRIRVDSFAGSPPKESVETYNGEFTVSYVNDPARNRLGGPHDEKTHAAGERYRSAIINNALGPDGRGPNRRRNPFSFVDQWVIDTLTKLHAQGKTFDVQPVEGTEGAFEIRFQLPSEEDPYEARHVATVDRDKGWVITSHERRSPEGNLLALKTCELEQDANGVWLPKRGCWQTWGNGTPTTPPDTEWRYEVGEIALNDPNFDGSLFELALEPGTFVNDNRRHVTYWVSDEPAIGPRLTELAQSAVEKEAAMLARIKPRPADITRPSGRGERKSFLITLIIVNIVIALIFAALWRKRRPAS